MASHVLIARLVSNVSGLSLTRVMAVKGKHVFYQLSAERLKKEIVENRQDDIWGKER